MLGARVARQDRLRDHDSRRQTVQQERQAGQAAEVDAGKNRHWRTINSLNYSVSFIFIYTIYLVIHSINSFIFPFIHSLMHACIHT